MALLLAWSSPTSADVLDEYNAWYTETHIPQVREAIPAITRVTRHRLTDPVTGEGQPLPRYLAIYEIDGDDVPAAAAALGKAAAEGRLDQTDTMNVTDAPSVLEWYRS